MAIQRSFKLITVIVIEGRREADFQILKNNIREDQKRFYIC